METLITAYLAALIAIVFYVARLGAEQQRIRRTLEALQSQHEDARWVAGAKRSVPQESGPGASLCSAPATQPHASKAA